ncbi:ATP-binding cassette domain-containing protein [Streptomyces sp. NPDC059740]|uniref:ATP-binding cassette domain-containing protein n=1 Tax=Streptomyces sp. NPDC059740 TaxID=3346926 RepID=UPI003660CE72
MPDRPPSPAPLPHPATDSTPGTEALPDAPAEAPADRATALPAPADRPRQGAPEPVGAALEARGLGMAGPRGPVFEDVDLSAPPGSLVLLHGPSGSGRTCLLLALTGRMRPTRGTASVAGLPLPRRMSAVRRMAALAQVPGVLDLEPALSVAEHLRERELLSRRFGPLALTPAGRRRRREGVREAAREALHRSGLRLAELPRGGDTRVRDLTRLQTLRLSVALALVEQPRLLAVDDVDLKLAEDERQAAWDLLRSVADAGTTVLAVCGELPAPEGRERPEGRLSPGTAAAHGRPEIPVLTGLRGVSAATGSGSEAASPETAPPPAHRGRRREARRRLPLPRTPRKETVDADPETGRS